MAAIRKGMAECNKPVMADDVKARGAPRSKTVEFLVICWSFAVLVWLALILVVSFHDLRAEKLEKAVGVKVKPDPAEKDRIRRQLR
jgi:hypothetical protein